MRFVPEKMKWKVEEKNKRGCQVGLQKGSGLFGMITFGFIVFFRFK